MEQMVCNKCEEVLILKATCVSTQGFSFDSTSAPRLYARHVLNLEH